MVGVIDREPSLGVETGDDAIARRERLTTLDHRVRAGDLTAARAGRSTLPGRTFEAHAASMNASPLVTIACLVAASCASATVTVRSTSPETPAAPPVRLVFVGDLMLGRGVAPVVAGDPTSVFERLRSVIVGADLAFGNLESPLTDRPHLVGEHALEADPTAAGLLAGAGFDVMSIANNHAADAGPDTVSDTVAALSAAGLRSVGAGTSAETVSEPLVIDIRGITVGVAAFDNAGGPATSGEVNGINAWNLDAARTTVTELRRNVDVVVVSLHGGVEYLPRPDPALAHVTELLAEWGADVIWGHGAHVIYPVATSDHGGRTSVVAAGLGNALFDQRTPQTRVGSVLEVLADRDGVIAMRTGRLEIDAGRTAFTGWDDPATDAVALDADWWTPVAPWAPADGLPREWDVHPLRDDAQEIARSIGDVTGTGAIDLVVAYRRPARPERAHDTFDGVDWFDQQGRTAHIAVYTSEGRMRWGSAVMFQPVGAIAACDGAMALGLTTMDDEVIIAGGAWIWDGFGFRTASVLPGSAMPTCADIDHDGRTDPVLAVREPMSARPNESPTTNETSE